jgi:hypothetical protein
MRMLQRIKQLQAASRFCTDKGDAGRDDIREGLGEGELRRNSPALGRGVEAWREGGEVKAPQATLVYPR